MFDWMRKTRGKYETDEKGHTVGVGQAQNGGRNGPDKKTRLREELKACHMSSADWREFLVFFPFLRLSFLVLYFFLLKKYLLVDYLI